MDALRIGNFEIRNRLIVGTGKYSSYENMVRALEVGGRHVVNAAFGALSSAAHSDIHFDAVRQNLAAAKD
jgi:thiazole synthase ThiGH ThiG subunit